MAYGYTLLADRKMRLEIGQISLVRFTAPVGNLSPVLPLLAQEVRLLSALVNKKAAELEIFLLTGKLV
ncbi:hypothetical protein D3C80_1968980 [compost metagenome]